MFSTAFARSVLVYENARRIRHPIQTLHNRLHGDSRDSRSITSHILLTAYNVTERNSNFSGFKHAHARVPIDICTSANIIGDISESSQYLEMRSTTSSRLRAMLRLVHSNQSSCRRSSSFCLCSSPVFFFVLVRGLVSRVCCPTPQFRPLAAD